MEDLLVVNIDGQIPSEFNLRDLNLKTLFHYTQPYIGLLRVGHLTSWTQLKTFPMLALRYMYVQVYT